MRPTVPLTRRFVRLLPTLLAAVLGVAASAHAASPTVTTGAASNIGPSGAVLNASATPNGAPTGVRFQFGLTTAYGAGTPLQPIGDGSLEVAVHTPVGNLTPNTTYHYRAVAVTKDAATGAEVSVPGADQTFTTAAAPTAAPPTVTTGAATDIRATAAAANGSVTPNGAPTAIHFEFGTDATYGRSTPLQNAGDGANPVAVHVALLNLLPSTTYHFRLVATNSAGTTNGADQTFTTAAAPTATPPAVTTGAATDIQAAAAALNGTVTPNGASTAVHFEFGTDATYGHSTPLQSVGDGTNAVAVRFPLLNLQPNATYHFRLVAANSAGTTNGADQTFTTLSAPTTNNPPTVTTGLAREITASGAILNATCNPNGNSSAVRFEFGTTTSYGQSTPNQLAGNGASEVAVHIPVGNLQASTTYHFRAVIVAHTSTGAEVRVNGADQTFTTLASTVTAPPAATTGAAGEVQATGAVLTASVNPNGGATAVKFEFGADTAYGRSTPTQNLSGGTAAVSVRIPVGALTPGTTYHFRVVATNAAGTTTGDDQSFTTLSGPAATVYTGPAGGVTAEGAQLTGKVVANGKTLSVSFEYGATAAYGSQTEVKTVTGGSTAVGVSAAVHGLSAHTTYHYRITASDGAQTVSGADQVFKTLNTPPTVESDFAILPDGATSVTVAVLANDKDADGDTLTVAKVSQGEHGAATINSDGTVTYTPDAGFRGRDRFGYQVQDGFGGFASAQVTIQSQLVASSGLYNSLVTNDAPAHENSGYIRLATTAAGSFTGVLKFAAAEYPLKGRFDDAGAFAATLNVRDSDTDLALSLQLDTVTQQITGTVTVGDLVSSLSADRIPYTTAQPAPQAGRYTVLLPPASDADPAAPQGTGFAAMTVNVLGQVTLTGRLGDGTPLSAGGWVNEDGTFPLYSALYRAPKGSAFGVVTFRDVANISDCDGSVRWFKPAQAASATTSAGFDTTIDFVGSLYMAPERGARVLNLADSPANATLTFAPAGSDAALDKTVTITAGNRVLPPDGDRTVAMAIAPATGLFTGSVALPGSAGTVRAQFAGAVLQKQNLGGGLLLSGDQTGSASLTAAVSAPAPAQP